jgi:hypothetical protein
MKWRRRALISALLIVSLVSSAWRPPVAGETRAVPTSPARWQPKTHIFAANLALEDALDDGHVTIRPFGEFPVRPAVLGALRRFPDVYRAGVMGPDVFPDLYVGQSLTHTDRTSKPGGWMSDDWLRHVLNEAQTWRSEGADQDGRSLAFAYGFLTHAAGDMFGHSFINRYARGPWNPNDLQNVTRHVVLEGYVGEKTPATDLTIAVGNRFVAAALIKHHAVRAQTRGVHYYRAFLEVSDRVDAALERAKRGMNEGVGEERPYWVKCAANPVWCSRKEFLETWREDIDRGLEALVDANREVGAAILSASAPDAMSAFSSWTSEWIPKIFGGHVAGGVVAWLAEVNLASPLTAPARKGVLRLLDREFDKRFELIRKMTNPRQHMHEVFDAATRDSIDRELYLMPGPDSLLAWHHFAPLYNTVVLSKLVLLDGDALNELVRRAGVPRLLYPSDANVMLRVMKSMDGDLQWQGEPHGLAYVAFDGSGFFSGFALWGDDEAREKVFVRIFKGYGPGPGQEALPPAGRPLIEDEPAGSHSSR